MGADPDQPGLPDRLHPMDALTTALNEHLTRLRGRLFETVEACGFPAKQEDAAKRLIRHITYDAQREMEALKAGRSNADRH